MTLTFNKNDGFARFVSCGKGAGLLNILSQAASRVNCSRTHHVFPDGFKFTGGFKPEATSRNNLTAAEFFEGKFRGENNQNNINRLEERTPPAPNS